MKEVWKDITGFKGKYQVSNLGRVKSLVRYKVKKERILSYRPNNKGYNRIGLTKNNKSKDFLIHRLVAQAFISNPDNLDTVDHRDNNKDNNFVKNLRWLSNLANWKRSNMGEDNPKSKMTKEKVKQLRGLYLTGNYTYKELGEKFNISKAQAWVINTKKNWKDEKTY